MWRRSLALLALSATVGPWLAAGPFMVSATIAQGGFAGLAGLDWGTVFGALTWSVPLLASVIVGLGNVAVGYLVARTRDRLALAAFLGGTVFFAELNWVVQENAHGGLNAVGVLLLVSAGALASMIQVAAVDAVASRKLKPA